MRLPAMDNFILMVTACTEHDYFNLRASNMIPSLILKSQEAVLS